MKPWEKYKQLDESELPVIQTMHPDLKSTDRLAVKNFSNSPDESINYLRKQYPQLNFALKDNQIVVRRPDEERYQVLDPNTGFFSSDILNDVGDIGMDAINAVVEGAGTVAGGLGGFVAGGGIGAIPGAMAGGAASGAATEALRQALGKALDVNETFDNSSVAINAGLSGVSPLLFGVGAPGAKTAAKLGLSQAQRKAFDEAGAGAFSRLVRGGGKKIASMLTGVPEETIDTYGKRFKEVDLIDDGKRVDMIQAAREGAEDVIDNQRRDIGQQIGREYDRLNDADGIVKIGSPEMVKNGNAAFNLRKTTEPVMEEILKRREAYQRTGNPYQKELYEEARNSFYKTFKGMRGAQGDDLVNLKSRLNELSKAYKLGKQRFKNSDSVEDKVLSNAYLSSYNALNDSLDETLGGALKPLNKRYSQTMKDLETLNKMVGTDEKADSLFRNFNSNSKSLQRQNVKNLDDTYGLNIGDTAKLINAYDLLGKAALNPLSSGGTTSTSRSVLGAGLGGAIGTMYGDGQMDAGTGVLLGGALTSPWALKQILRSQGTIKNLYDTTPFLPSSAIKRNIWGDLYEQQFSDK